MRPIHDTVAIPSHFSARKGTIRGMSLLHSEKTSTRPVTDGHYPSVATTPLKAVSNRASDDAYPGLLRTLAMWLVAR